MLQMTLTILFFKWILAQSTMASMPYNIHVRTTYSRLSMGMVMLISKITCNSVARSPRITKGC